MYRIRKYRIIILLHIYKVHYRQYCEENFKSFYEYPKDTSLINPTLLPLILTKAIGGINLNVQMNILLQNILFTILSIGKQDLFINTKWLRKILYHSSWIFKKKTWQVKDSIITHWLSHFARCMKKTKNSISTKWRSLKAQITSTTLKREILDQPSKAFSNTTFPFYQLYSVHFTAGQK